jgi:chemotaxis protein MotA
MGSIFGFIFILAMVFGGYILAGGNMAIIMHAIPHEMMAIGGAAVGAFIIGNDKHVVKHTLHDLKLIVKGSKWTKEDYRSLLCLLFEIIRVAKQNPMALEKHIDDPMESDIFKKYPKIIGDETALSLICDYMRTAGMSLDDPYQVEDIMDREVSKNLENNMHSAHALQTMSDGLPAIGIVAAVLGVIKTMGSIDQPPAVLGKMIGGALVGTFLGVFLSYCLVGPLGQKIKSIHEQDHLFYAMIKDVMISYLHKHQPNTCVEIARKNVPKMIRPSFVEVEEAIRSLKNQPQAAA